MSTSKYGDNMSIVDNLTYFRHLRYPQVIICNPKHTFLLREIKSKKTIGIYGCVAMPDKKDVLCSVLHLRVFENCDISYDNYDPYAYEFVIDGTTIWKKTKSKKGLEEENE